MPDINDPLSTATRATKRNLLVASMLAISANAFNVSIEKIPLAGLSINFDDRLFSFLLLAALIYFLTTFTLYYFIDIKNFEQTPHQQESEKTFSLRQGPIEDAYIRRMSAAINSVVPEGHRVALDHNLSDKLDKGVFKTACFYIYLIPPPGKPLVKLEEDKNEELYAGVVKVQDEWLRRYPRYRAIRNFRARTMIRAIRITYITRNYIVDGVFPVLLGVTALVAVLGLVDLHSLQDIFPRFKYFGHAMPLPPSPGE